MKSIPTMKDIADELDITVMSVSKALSGKEGVSDELRARIVAKAEEIGYKKSAPVKETSSKKHRNSCSSPLIECRRYFHVPSAVCHFPVISG